MKRVLISSQAWYLPEICDSCDAFHLMKGHSEEDQVNATIAWCELIEEKKTCKKRKLEHEH